MTVADLITHILCAVAKDFYRDRAHEFQRDKTALMKAVGRYGHECQQRGWEFSVSDILREISSVLDRARKAKAQPRYVPIYLETAIGRHVGQRAEELQVRARATKTKVTKLVQGVRGVEAVREASNVDILAALYLDLKQKAPKRPQLAKLRKLPEASQPQPELL